MNRLTALGMAGGFAIKDRKILACLPDYWDPLDWIDAALNEWGVRHKTSKIYGAAEVRNDVAWIRLMPTIGGHDLRGVRPDIIYIEGGNYDRSAVRVAELFGAEVIRG